MCSSVLRLGFFCFIQDLTHSGTAAHAVASGRTRLLEPDRRAPVGSGDRALGSMQHIAICQLKQWLSLRHKRSWLAASRLHPYFPGRCKDLGKHRSTNSRLGNEKNPPVSLSSWRVHGIYHRSPAYWLHKRLKGRPRLLYVPLPDSCAAAHAALLASELERVASAKRRFSLGAVPKPRSPAGARAAVNAVQGPPSFAKLGINLNFSESS